MPYKSIIAVIVFAFVFSGCTNEKAPDNLVDTAQLAGHPAWIMQGNVYEVNVRQYTPEGTFKAFAKHLDRLKMMGVQTLWFMPINPISKIDRKGTLGSYYAVADYTAINPEYGTLEDWKQLVKEAHNKGFKVIIDWVPNHTGADHYWLEKHPDFYVHDSTGKAISQFDWTDTRKLNFNNPVLADTMISQMKFWVENTGIDGLRCDYAVGPKADNFWNKCTAELKKIKNLFLLAEADSAWLHKAGFDATYAWPEFGMMKQIAAGNRNALGLDSVFKAIDTTIPKNGLRFYFTSNHDENSWNKADFATMPGPIHAPFAVLTQTMAHGIPMIYSGQEEPFLRAIKFFDKDTISFGKYGRAIFYQKLLQLRKDNSALSALAAYHKLTTSDDTAIFAFSRANKQQHVVVLLNLGNQPKTFIIKEGITPGNGTELFSNTKQALANGMSVSLPAWGYQVFSY
jgi:glycosidase